MVDTTGHNFNIGPYWNIKLIIIFIYSKDSIGLLHMILPNYTRNMNVKVILKNWKLAWTQTVHV